MKNRRLLPAAALPTVVLALVSLALAGPCPTGQDTSPLPVRYEELTAPEFARAVARSGAICDEQARLSGLKHAYTGIWWYASQPNHYRGDGSAGNKELGRAILDIRTSLLVEMIRSVKNDTVTMDLQRRFYEDSAKPLEIRPVRKK